MNHRLFSFGTSASHADNGAAAPTPVPTAMPSSSSAVRPRLHSPLEDDAASALVGLCSGSSPPGAAPFREAAIGAASYRREAHFANNDERAPTTISKSDGGGSHFPAVLMSILSDPANSHVISWTPDGQSFVIIRPQDLVESVLPRLSNGRRASKYCSFARKLHRYGFRRASSSGGSDVEREDVFWHESFRRDAPELCGRIRVVAQQQQRQRRASSLSEMKAADVAGEAGGSPPLPSSPPTPRAVATPAAPSLPSLNRAALLSERPGDGRGGEAALAAASDRQHALWHLLRFQQQQRFTAEDRRGDAAAHMYRQWLQSRRTAAAERRRSVGPLLDAASGLLVGGAMGERRAAVAALTLSREQEVAVQNYDPHGREARDVLRRALEVMDDDSVGAAAAAGFNAPRPWGGKRADQDF